MWGKLAHRVSFWSCPRCFVNPEIHEWGEAEGHRAGRIQCVSLQAAGSVTLPEFFLHPLDRLIKDISLIRPWTEKKNHDLGVQKNKSKKIMLINNMYGTWMSIKTTSPVWLYFQEQTTKKPRSLEHDSRVSILTIEHHLNTNAPWKSVSAMVRTAWIL